MRQAIAFVVLLICAPGLASVSPYLPELAFAALVFWTLAGLTLSHEREA